MKSRGAVTTVLFLCVNAGGGHRAVGGPALPAGSREVHPNAPANPSAAPATPSAAPAVTARVVPSPTGDQWEIANRGTVIARFAARTPARRRGPPTIRQLAVEGQLVVELRVPVLDRAGDELWLGDVRPLAEHPARAARVIWSGLTGPQDVDGETSVFVDVSPERIVEYQTAAQVSRCDGETVELFPRAWDFASHRFRPVTSELPERSPMTVTVTARRRDPAMPDRRPLGAFRFTAASTTRSAGADARRLEPPIELNDGDPATVWTEGLGGDGRGEFLTAHSSAGIYPLRGLRIVPGDATSARSFERRNRLRSLRVAYGPDPKQSFDVDFPEDPALGAAGVGDARAPYWVPFPRRAESTCITITILDVYRGSEPGPAHAGTTAISDLEIFAEIDSPDGLARLIADAAAGERCAGRSSLLLGVGEPAVSPLARAVLEAPAGAGRECLVTALVALVSGAHPPDNPLVMDALVTALRGASTTEEEAIVGVLRRLPAPPVSALAGLLHDPAGAAQDRARAARVLGQLAGPDSSARLLAAAGEGPPELRLAVVQALGQSAPTGTAPVLAALAAVQRQRRDETTRRREADLVRVLPALVARTPTDTASALALVRKSLADSADYETEARAIAALGAIGDPSIVGDLARLRADSEDAVLRYLAVRELGGTDTAAARAALREALTDGDPRVRETAAEGLRDRGDAASEAALIDAAKSDPWPFARRAQIEALARTCGAPARDLLLRALERDVPEVQRAALAGLVRCRDARAPALLLTTLKTRSASASLRDLAAGLMGDLDDDGAGADGSGSGNGATARPAVTPTQRDLARQHARAHALAELVPGLVNEAEGDLALEGVVVSALRSLGQLRGPDAARVVAGLTQDHQHPYQHVAIEVLGQICDRDLGARTLRTLRASKDVELSVAATSAESACRGQKP